MTLLAVIYLKVFLMRGFLNEEIRTRNRQHFEERESPTHPASMEEFPTTVFACLLELFTRHLYRKRNYLL